MRPIEIGQFEVVRDSRLPTLDGRYYGDFCVGWVRTFRLENGKAVGDEPLGVTILQLNSFGVDGTGRVYAASAAGGVYRFDPASGWGYQRSQWITSSSAFHPRLADP